MQTTILLPPPSPTEIPSPPPVDRPYASMDGRLNSTIADSNYLDKWVSLIVGSV